MTINELKELIAAGNFHHATFRTDFARGLHIYCKPKNPGPKSWAFDYVGYFPEKTPECGEAYNLTRASGIYEGSYR